jgi:hypothetical protein
MRTYCRRFIATGILACCALSSTGALAGRSAAISSTDDPANWLGSGWSALDGVAAISLSGGSGFCSGSLLAGGEYLVTAAHCVSDASTGAQSVFSFSVDFQGGAVNRGVSAVAIAPGWHGAATSLGDGSDLALLRLSAPVTTIAGYGLSPTLDVGKAIVVAGYGRIGTGAGGADYGSYGALHYGYNVNDTTDYALNTALRAAGYGDQLGPMYPTLYGETYVYDFDSGQAAHNALQRLYGLTGVALGSDLGAGVGEAMIAPGDSGGGDFVLADGQYLLSGVHSYGWNLCTSVANGGVSDALADCTVLPGGWSSFGSLGGSTAVYSALSWIEGVTGVSAVPEAGAWALWLAGLPLLRRAARRRGG